MITATYECKQEYKEDRQPYCCFGHGDRIAYVLSETSRQSLGKRYGVNLWGEYDATLNFFADGHVNLMKTVYDSRAEEFDEEEVFVIPQKDLGAIALTEE